MTTPDLAALRERHTVLHSCLGDDPILGFGYRNFGPGLTDGAVCDVIRALAAGVWVTGGDLLALADEWCDRTAPDDVARLNVRGFAVWANLRAGVRVTGEALEQVLDDHYDRHAMSDEDGHCDRLCAAELHAAGVRVTGDAGLDVERLARALIQSGLYIDAEDPLVGVEPPKALAATIAREYAALNRETPA